MNGVVMELAFRGWPVWICDPKRIEFLGMRGWPNVQVVATTVPDQVVVIYQVLGGDGTPVRADRVRRGLRGRLRAADPRAGRVPRLLRHRGRVVRRHQGHRHANAVPGAGEARFPGAQGPVRAGARDPGTAAPGCRRARRGDARQLRHPDLARPAVPAGRDDDVGVPAPRGGAARGTAGRATAVSDDARPLEVQAYWTPDPRRAAAARHPADLALLERLKLGGHPPPAAAGAPRRGAADHPGCERSLAWAAVAGGQLVPAVEQQADSATADTGPLSWLVLAGEPAAAPTTEPAVPVEADDEDDEELDVDEQICVDELAPGDLVCVEERPPTWALVGWWSPSSPTSRRRPGLHRLARRRRRGRLVGGPRGRHAHRAALADRERPDVAPVRSQTMTSSTSSGRS